MDMLFLLPVVIVLFVGIYKEVEKDGRWF